MKFNYAPGLPGYGTRGVDGSIGLTGLSLYFSDYDGTADAITLSSRITNNKLLTTSNVDLPGYPTRKFQNGDFFIDKNGLVYKIDLTATNKYTNTGTRLNTTSLFEEGPTTTNAPTEYTRYSNAFVSDKRLVDSVNTYTEISNYALAPSAANGVYGIGAADFSKIIYTDNSVNGYEPFIIYSNTNNISNPEKSLALVKKNGADVWRFGNADSALAARDVSLHLDFAYVDCAGTLQVKGGNSNSITSDSELYITTLSINGTSGGSAGAIHMQPGTSGSHTTGTSGAGSNITLNAGNGGDVSSGTAGKGGDVNIYSGEPGNVTDGGDGGVGGKIVLWAADGKDAGTGTAAAGGNIEFTTGNGGSGSGSLAGGAGGDFIFTAGDGGAGDSFGGPGGDFKVYAGNGGDVGPDAGGGGDILLQGGDAAGSSFDGGDIILRMGQDDSNAWGSNKGNLVIVGLGQTGSAYRYLLYNPDTSISYYSSGTYASDLRLKDLISPVTNISERLSTLTPYYYKFNDFSKKEVIDSEDSIQIGVIAQEVEKVFPEFVSDFEGNDKKKYKGVDYDKMAPLLIGALNEQKREIDELKIIVQQQQEQINQLLNK